uniref:Rho-related GTP-binding protein RhoF n=1 Tax=Petromyzon marinus TaxID=7757 RepID=A0AAJ7TW37_PETMA|nr:rho-related GTP-binding protein RhoF [Petromyzon marinus]
MSGGAVTNGSVKEQQSTKVVIVGDGGCGKTSLLTVFTKGEFPLEYAATVYEQHQAVVTMDGFSLALQVMDTAGQEDYDRLRPLCYNGASVVLLCYDVMCPTSFDNIVQKWNPEMRHFCPGVPSFLIGCKTDLRKDREKVRKLRSGGQEPITYKQGAALAKEVEARDYIECSAKDRDNVETIFKEAASAALQERAALRTASKRRRFKACTLL